MVARQFATDVLIRDSFRAKYMNRALVNTRPTRYAVPCDDSVLVTLHDVRYESLSCVAYRVYPADTDTKCIGSCLCAPGGSQQGDA